MNSPKWVDDYESIEELNQRLGSIDEVWQYIWKVARTFAEWEWIKISWRHDNCLLNTTYVSNQLILVIKKSLNNFFKHWLKDWEVIEYDTKRDIDITFCNPTSKSLKEVSEWKMKWIIAFKLKIELCPRYKHQWDTWIYEFLYEIKIK